MLMWPTRRELFLLLIGSILIATLEFVLSIILDNAEVNNNPQSQKSKQEHDPFFGRFAIPGARDLVSVGWDWLHDNHEATLSGFTIGLFVVTFLLAKYTKRLWGSTSTLADDTRIASSKTIRRMSQTARQQLRPYVAVEDVYFRGRSDERVPYTATDVRVPKIRVRNYGNTPAYCMSIWADRAWKVPEFGFHPKYSADPMVPAQMLSPSQHYSRPLLESNEYTIGQAGFFIYGKIVYDDSFRCNWTTKFCFKYEGRNSFIPYGDYNGEEGIGTPEDD